MHFQSITIPECRFSDSCHVKWARYAEDEGLASSFPFTYDRMLMGSLSLIGFHFLTRFYSKNVILELAYTKYTISGKFAFWLGSVSTLFTSYYSFRLLFQTFIVPSNSFRRDILWYHDVPIHMAIPLILLALGCLFVGYLAKVWPVSP